jgi:hypothetical protein
MKWMIVALLFVLPYASHAQAPDFLRAPTEAQDSLFVNYGKYFTFSFLGSLGGGVVGGVIGARIFREEIEHDFLGGLNVIPVMLSGYVLGGVTGATLGGHDRKRIFLYALGGHLAFIGTLAVMAQIHERAAGYLGLTYLVGMPFFTSAIAYSVDKAFVRSRRRVRVAPVMSFGKRSSTLGVRLTF